MALGPADLRACPTTWAHRLAFGRDPRALWLHGTRATSAADAPGGGFGEAAAAGLAPGARPPGVATAPPAGGARWDR
jgi:hypothetical protein